MKNIIFPLSSGGGSSSYTEVANFAALPLASLVSGSTYLVIATTGVIFINRKLAGLYKSNGTTWDYLGDVTSYVNTVGGIAGQVLAKVDSTDFNTQWVTPPNLSAMTNQGNTFNGASQLVKLDATGKLPAVDGSLLTGIGGGGVNRTIFSQHTSYLSGYIYSSFNYSGNSYTTITSPQNQSAFIEIKSDVTINALVCAIETGVAGGFFSISLVSFNSNLASTNVVATSGELSSAVAGFQICPVTPTLIPKGLYAVTILTSIATHFRKSDEFAFNSKLFGYSSTAGSLPSGQLGYTGFKIYADYNSNPLTALNGKALEAYTLVHPYIGIKVQ